jgi:hypothetical protein
MRSYLQTKTGLILVSVVSLCVVLLMIFNWRKLTTIEAQESANPRTEVREVDDPEWRQGLSLSEMMQRSSLVIVGDALSGTSRLSQNGQTITTDYQIRVRETIKGSLAPRSIVSVSLPGGMIKKPDGTLFEIRARKFRYMVRNKVYVLFLKEVPSSEGVFTAVRGPQGIYELRRDNLKGCIMEDRLTFHLIQIRLQLLHSLES